LVAESAGALGALVVNSAQAEAGKAGPPQVDESDLFLMGFDGSQREVTIPAFMLTHADGHRLQRCLEGAGEEEDSREVRVEMRRYEDRLVASVQASGESVGGERRVTVTGSLSHLFVALSSGWTVEIEEKESKMFHLNIH
jgi:hypothetical protein